MNELFVLMNGDKFARGGGSSTQSRIRAYETEAMAKRAAKLVRARSTVIRRFVMVNDENE